MVLFTSTLSLLIFCLLLLLITDRGAEASNCKGGFVYFSLRFCLFTSCVLLLYCRVYTHCCCSVPKLCLTLSTPRSAAGQASLSSTISQSLLKLMSIESVIPSRPLSPPSRPALSFPASGSPVNQLFASVSPSTRASALASVLPMNIQD